MPRKAAGTLDQQRAQMMKKYRRGTKVNRTIGDEASLTDIERIGKMEYACLLKAQGFSHSYIGQAVSLQRGVISKWMELPAMKQRVADIQVDFVDGAVRMLRMYAGELLEMLIEIARTSEDEKVALQAILEGLDRIGITKVNKSESAAVVTKKSEVDLVDKSGLLSAMADAPPEIQQEMAAKMDEMLAIASEHSVRDVTHG